MDQQPQHRQQERGAQKFRRAEDAHLGEQRFQQSQCGAGQYQLDQQRDDGQRQRAPNRPTSAMP